MPSRRRVSFSRPRCAIDLGGGRWLHLDGADRERRFGVEVDHVTWHGGRLATQQDKWRDRQVMRLGWVVARVTDEDIEQRLNATVAELCEIHRLRCVKARVTGGIVTVIASPVASVGLLAGRAGGGDDHAVDDVVAR